MPPRRSPAAKAELTTGEVPAGAKQITRTTTERFQTPIDDELKNENSVVDDVDTESGDVVDDVDNSEAQLFDPEPPSALDSLLESLKGVGEITIYVVRKPDPVGMTFEDSCSIQRTAGSLPFDESFTSKEAIELAVQSAFGGGKYQLQVRNNTAYVTAWTTHIADPRRRANPQSSAAEQYVQAPSPPQRSAREELQDILSVAKDIADIRGRGGRHEDTPALPPVTPADAIKETVGLFTAMREASNTFAPPPPPVSNGNGSEHWSIGLLNGVGNFFNSSGLRELVVDGGKYLLAEAARNKREEALKAASETRNKNGKSTNPQSGPNGHNQNNQPDHGEQGESVTVSEAEMKVLGVVIEQLRAYELDDENDLLETRVATAAGALRTLPAEALTQLIATPNLLLLMSLSTLKLEWADVADMTDAGQFITALKKHLIDGGPARDVEPEKMDHQEGSGEAAADEKPGEEGRGEKA